MGSVLIQLLPLVIGSIMMPTWVLLVLFMLRSRHGLVAAIAFVCGVTAVKLVQGVIFGAVFSAYDATHIRNLTGTILSTLLLVVGVLMCVSGLKQVFGQEDDDFGNPLPKLLGMIHALTPARAFGLGALLVVTSSRAWIFTLTALGIINRANLDFVQSVAVFLLYVLGTEILLIVPIVVSTRSSARFDKAASWIEEHNRPIVVTVSFVVGGFFLWTGLTGLIG